MHRQVDGDQFGFVSGGFVQGLPCKVNRYDCVAAFAQPSRGRRQPEWLPT
jgi:hypothetical protein